MERRTLTPLGKIVVIKALVASRLTYLLTNLPDPSNNLLNQIEAEFFQFLWNGKPSKIKKSVVFQSYEQGGLKMLNIHSVLTTLKLSWIQRLMNDGDLAQNSYNLYPELQKVSKFGVEYRNKIRQTVNNPFWNDVLKHFKKLSLKCTPTNMSEFASEHIHYNANITRGNNVIEENEWIEAGILKTGDLMGINNAFLSYEEFKEKYDLCARTNFLLYEGIIRAIKHYQQRLNLNNDEVCIKGLDSKAWFNLRRGKMIIKALLLQSDTSTIPTAVIKWNTIFPNLVWNGIFKRTFKINSKARQTKE